MSLTWQRARVLADGLTQDDFIEQYKQFFFIVLDTEMYLSIHQAAPAYHRVRQQLKAVIAGSTLGKRSFADAAAGDVDGEVQDIIIAEVEKLAPAKDSVLELSDIQEKHRTTMDKVSKYVSDTTSKLRLVAVTYMNAKLELRCNTVAEDRQENSEQKNKKS